MLSSFAPPIVGILAQHLYGYKPIPKGSSDAVEIETDRENAASLAKAVYTAIGLPMAICCAIYSFLYCTYPRDRERARMDALIDSETQEAGNPSFREEECSEFQVLDSDELYEKERSVVEVNYGGERNLDFDDNDEKTLLPP